MIEFLHAAFAFPTVIFTTLMGAMLVYWCLVIFGALDMDALDSGADGVLDGAADGVLDGAADGVLDGAADGVLDGVADGVLDGAADGVLDGVADGVLDGAADGVLDGAADGVLDGAADGVLDGAADGVLDGAADGVLDGAADGATEGLEGGPLMSLHQAGAAAALTAFLRIGKVPVTIMLSLLVTWSWLFSLMGSLTLSRGGLHGLVYGLLAFGVGIAGFGLAIPVTSFTLRPLEKLFATETTRVQETLVGQSCTITSLHVDGKFGTAAYNDGAAGLILHVRCNRANDLKKGEEALIVGYDREKHFYQVEPMVVTGAARRVQLATQTRPAQASQQARTQKTRRNV